MELFSIQEGYLGPGYVFFHCEKKKKNGSSWDNGYFGVHAMCYDM